MSDGDGKIFGKLGCQNLRAARRTPHVGACVIRKMGGPRHGRGQPNLARRHVLVDDEFAPVGKTDGQNAVGQIDVRIVGIEGERDCTVRWRAGEELGVEFIA